MLARETTATLKPASVSLLGGKFTANVLAAAPVAVHEVTVEGGAKAARLVIPIGATVPVECVVGADVDAAAWVKAVLPPLDGAASDPPVVHVSVHGGREVLHSMHLRLKDHLLHQHQFATSARLGSGVQCLLGGAGYSATFERVVGELVSSLKRSDEVVPLYREANEFSSRSAVVGMETVAVYDRGDNKRAVISTLAMLALVEGSLSAVDGVEVELVDPANEIVSITRLVVIDGKVTEQLDATRTKKSSYTVKGTAQGRPYDTTVTTVEPIASAFTIGERRRSLAAGKSGSVEWLSLDSTVSPPIAERVAATMQAGRTFLITQPKASRTCDVDAAGRCASARATDGSLAMKRVLDSGDFWAKARAR